MLADIECVLAGDDTRAEASVLAWTTALLRRAYNEGATREFCAPLRAETKLELAGLEGRLRRRMHAEHLGEWDAVLPSAVVEAWCAQPAACARAIEKALGRDGYEARVYSLVRAASTGVELVKRLYANATPANRRGAEDAASDVQTRFDFPPLSARTAPAAVYATTCALLEAVASGDCLRDGAARCHRLALPSPTLAAMGERILELLHAGDGQALMRALSDRLAGGASGAGCIESTRRTLDDIALWKSAFGTVGFLAGLATVLSDDAGDALAPRCTRVDGVLAAQLSLLLLNLVPRALRRVRVGPSAMHGNGVIAAVACRPGDLLTMYPCHAVKIRGVCNADLVVWYREGAAVAPLEQELLHSYCVDVPETPIVVAGDPDVHDPAQCGHLINDGASLHTATFDAAELRAYVDASRKAQNCTIVPLAGCALAVVATAHIAKGAECFCSYGALFWASRAVA